MNMPRVLGFVFSGNRGVNFLEFHPLRSLLVPYGKRPMLPDFKGNQFET